MNAIFQDALPQELRAEVRLPGISPCDRDDWLRVDEAYEAQMAYRSKLLAEKRDAVLYMSDAAAPAARELLEAVLDILPAHGFVRADESLHCPDGRLVTLDRDAPLWTLGHLVQEDLCIMQRKGEEHVLTGAVLCFPASWKLSEKIGKPLTAIHTPVPEYDADLARRVQRMFDGVKVGRPLQRHNRLSYADSDLHQPFRKRTTEAMGFVRSERQCILRLPETDACIFTIHTWVVRN